MIAVCLMTCDRPLYTARTVDSFMARNGDDLSRFVLLHGDDASTDPAIGDLVRQQGFETVVQTRERIGIHALRTRLLRIAAQRAPWVLVLENDIESVRPFPWPLFQHVAKRPDVYCLRLFGRFKDADRREPCKTVHQWTGEPVVWWRMKRAPEPYELGQVHWTAQPAVTRTHDALVLHKKNRRELSAYTARVVDNVMVHIGAERTPGRVL